MGAPRCHHRVSRSDLSVYKLQKRYTALPTSNKTSTKKLATLIRWKTTNGIYFEEVVKFRNQLEEVSEAEEASIQGPRWSGPSRRRIAVTAE